MEIQILQLIIPSLLTIAGWLVAAWWALEQVKVAHENNAKLQRELLNESHRRYIARELIEIYKSIAQTGDSLRKAIFLFWLNYDLEKNDRIKGVKVNASHLVAPINEAYREVAQEIERLNMWLKVAGEQVPNASLLREAISDFHIVFSAYGVAEEVPKNHSWASYQGLLAAYQSNKDISAEKLDDRSKDITEAIGSFLGKLTEGTAQINRELCGA